MGRETNDPVIAQSSIALLQERFRQLERAKEMREERELSKLYLPEPKMFKRSPTLHYEPVVTGLLFHPELIIQPMSPPPQQQQPSRTTLSLWPNLPSKHGDFGRYVEAPFLMSLWQRETPSAQALMNRSAEDPATEDVDTSLHL